MINSIKNVAIVGGTHGNELTGVHLVKHWSENAKEVARNSFSTELHLANPRAIREVRRYIDQDLNRQFALNDLRGCGPSGSGMSGYEQQLAKSWDAKLGPKENPRVDFILDMHTTTANMGMSLIFNANDPLLIGMAFYIKQKMPHAKLFYDPLDRMEDNFLTSLGRLNGFLIEVGPIAQGLLNYHVYSETKEAVGHALDFLELKNTGQAIDLPKQMSGYRFTEKIPLPENTKGDLTAMVHPDLQNKDYQPIEPGDPLFITLAGETIAYEGGETVYGAFINEAAYYDRHIGLSFMEKVDIILGD